MSLLSAFNACGGNSGGIQRLIDLNRLRKQAGKQDFIVAFESEGK